MMVDLLKCNLQFVCATFSCSYSLPHATIDWSVISERYISFLVIHTHFVELLIVVSMVV